MGRCPSHSRQRAKSADGKPGEPPALHAATPCSRPRASCASNCYTDAREAASTPTSQPRPGRYRRARAPPVAALPLAICSARAHAWASRAATRRLPRARPASPRSGKRSAKICPGIPSAARSGGGRHADGCRQGRQARPARRSPRDHRSVEGQIQGGAPGPRLALMEKSCCKKHNLTRPSRPT